VSNWIGAEGERETYSFLTRQKEERKARGNNFSPVRFEGAEDVKRDSKPPKERPYNSYLEKKKGGGKKFTISIPPPGGREKPNKTFGTPPR